MAKHLLTDRAARVAQAKAKPYRIFDGDGLALWISPSGVKSWQLRYRHNAKEQTATLGKYPRITLAEARDKADEVRTLLDSGVHPGVRKDAERLRVTSQVESQFEAFAARWLKHEARRMKWTPDYRAEVERSMKHLAPLNRLPITMIAAREAIAVLNKVESAAPLMGEKVRRRLRSIFDYAVEKGLIADNPLPDRRRGPKVKRTHFPAMTDRAGVGVILRNARASDPAKGIARAHLLTAFTAQRIAEVVGAMWAEFDLVDATWSIPRSRMKRKDSERGPHVVPLPRELLAELKRWREADGPDAALVCPAPRDPAKPVTPEGVEKHYRDALGLAGKHSPHSWRTVFKTWCGDAGRDREAVESQLDHVVGNRVEAAYDRAHRFELRRPLMQWYENELIAARDGAQVVSLKRRG
jgi:integrase